MSNESTSRGATWLAALTAAGTPVAGYPASVRVVDAVLAGGPCRYIAVLPDPALPNEDVTDEQEHTRQRIERGVDGRKIVDGQ